MRTGIILTLLLSPLLSCDENNTDEIVDLPIGNYKGQFIRSSPHTKYDPSNVTLTFTADRFFGESDKIKYPAICNGTYKLTGREIEFTNDCPWTAEFDWTYILNGKFELSVDGDELVMTKYFGGHTDLYKLTLQ